MLLRNYIRRTKSRGITESRRCFIPPALNRLARRYFPPALFSNPVSWPKRVWGRWSERGKRKKRRTNGGRGGNWELQTFTVMQRRFEWGFLAWQQLVAEKKPPLDEFLRNLRVRFYRFTITRWQRPSETPFPPLAVARAVSWRFNAGDENSEIISTTLPRRSCYVHWNMECEWKKLMNERGKVNDTRATILRFCGSFLLDERKV